MQIFHFFETLSGTATVLRHKVLPNGDIRVEWYHDGDDPARTSISTFSPDKAREIGLAR